MNEEQKYKINNDDQNYTIYKKLFTLDFDVIESASNLCFNCIILRYVTLLSTDCLDFFFSGNSTVDNFLDISF